jgi:hypothetical protein
MSLNWPHCVIAHDRRDLSCPWCTTNSLAFPPALARVSRSIRHDALKIFYSQKRYKISLRYIDSIGLAQWLENVGTKYRSLVRMRMTAQRPLRHNPVFVEYTLSMFRKAGWEPELGRYRDGKYMYLTFGAPAVDNVGNAHT